MRATVHAGEVGARRRIRQLVLTGLLDDAVKDPQGVNSAVDAHRVADLNRRRESLLGYHRFVGLKPPEVATIEGIRTLGLGAYESWEAIDQPQLPHHQEPPSEGGDIPQIAAWDDDDIGHFPGELLDQLDADRFLPLDAQRIERVRQIDIVLLSDL